MAEGKATKKSSPAVKSRLGAEFREASQDASLAEQMKQLGISKAEMSEPVSIAVSALLERIGDLERELKTSREDFNELERLVDVDCLAPVPNRRALMRRLDWAISMNKRYGHPCSLIYFDLNGFKKINDEHTHAAGDEVIKGVAQVLTESLRVSDFMARLGGDEFIVLLYHAKEDSARKRATVIAKRIAANPFLWNSVPLYVTASYGIYEIREGDSAETALAHADKAMYAHKKTYQD